MPGGIDLSDCWEVATTWAIAPSMSAPSRRKIFTTLMPLIDWLSTCSMPSTVEKITRS